MPTFISLAPGIRLSLPISVVKNTYASSEESCLSFTVRGAGLGHFLREEHMDYTKVLEDE